MNNMLTFASREFRRFSELPFSTVDSMILSWLSYIQWPIRIFADSDENEVSIRDFFRGEYFAEMFENIKDKESTQALLTAAVASPRYREMKLRNYECNTCQETQEQFSAMTFVLEENLYYVAFRGTDSSFVGWKEDLNMAFQSPIPAQEHAADYFRNLAGEISGTFILGGHSKGGNLSIYAAYSNPSLAERIQKIYSHDGPGFLKEVTESDAFKNISGKIEKTVPQASIIGMLLEQNLDYHVVKSSGKSLAQHDLFTWYVEDGKLCPMPELTRDTLYLNKTIRNWLDGISREEREQFVDGLYQLLDTVDADTFLEFGADLPSNIPKVMESLSNIDSVSKDLIIRVVKDLARHSVKGLPGEFPWIKNDSED